MAVDSRYVGDPEAGGPIRIAVLASIAHRVPPRSYGPWEQVASTLAEGFVARGHEVTLFATADSLTTATLHSEAPAGYEEDASVDAKVFESLHIASVFERAAQFDVISNQFDFLPLVFSRLTDTPVVTTIHGFSSERLIPVFKAYDDIAHFVAISEADRHPGLTYAATIHHGIDVESFTFGTGAGGYLLFLEPAIDGATVTYVGPGGPSDRDRLLGGAVALLHLIDFDEPFGLSVVESLAAGTPVIASPRGSLPELIRPGETGYLVSGIDEAVEAVALARGLDRRACRADALERFSSERMVSDYERLFERLV